jgi:argininosuccinate lyase
MKNNNILRSRFVKEIDKKVEQFVASIPFDKRLYREDIAGSIAHVEMLAKQGIISLSDSKKIKSGLVEIRKEIEESRFTFKLSDEDIHINIENRLNQIIGDVAAKLHTARSRNDQIALDMRLYVREIIHDTISKIIRLQRAIINIAEKNIKTVMPGYTHLQHAQPVLFSHYMLAYFEMYKRDIARFEDCLKRVNVSPLGSGALAGVNYSIDRNYVANKLFFNEISANSIDAVSDRDFVLEYEAAAAICMMHLSRMAEEFVIWSSSEFSFIDIDESYCTSSSMMPQKKNPDVLELIRGKSGRVYGSLFNLLTVLKGLPLSYNRDMQEDKESLFNVVDTLPPCLELFSDIINKVVINEKRMFEVISKDYILATDYADYLVKKGVPFRKAYAIVGSLVNYAQKGDKQFEELSLKELKKFSIHFDNDIYKININKSVNNRNIHGGTALNRVKMSIKTAKKILDAYVNERD